MSAKWILLSSANPCFDCLFVHVCTEAACVLHLPACVSVRVHAKVWVQNEGREKEEEWEKILITDLYSFSLSSVVLLLKFKGQWRLHKKRAFLCLCVDLEVWVYAHGFCAYLCSILWFFKHKSLVVCNNYFVNWMQTLWQSEKICRHHLMCWYKTCF